MAPRMDAGSFSYRRHMPLYAPVRRRRAAAVDGTSWLALLLVLSLATAIAVLGRLVRA